MERLPDGAVRLPGSLGLVESQTWLGGRWHSQAATIGGHITAHLDRLPLEGEQLEIDGVRLTVTEMTPTAVRSIVVHEVREPASERSSAGGPAEA